MKQRIGPRWSLTAALFIMAPVGVGSGLAPWPAAAEPAVTMPPTDYVQSPGVGDRAAIVQQLRTELAKLLKQDPGQLPIDKPVTALGADDLDVVEWQMGAERMFRVDIDDAKVFDPASKGPRKDLTITSMAAIVQGAPRWPPGRQR